MAVTTGTTGLVTFASGSFATYASAVANIYEWSLNMTNPEYETTSFRDTTNTSGKTYDMGLWSGTGSLKAFLDNTTAPPVTLHSLPQTASTLTLLTHTGGDSFSFPAFLFNISVTVDRQGGLNVIDCTFESAGDLTVA